MNDKLIEFHAAIHDLRYNYPSGVTTFGPCCVDGCNNSARGSGKCADHCEADIAKLLGDDKLAKRIHDATREASRSIGDAELILEQLND